ALLEKIKLFLTKVVSDEKIIANHKNQKLFRDLILKILKSSVQDIEALKS
ncbi:MAG: putative membrane-bound spermidine synthase, partial [Vicingaceae bacterium]